MSHFKAKMHQIRFRLGRPPDPAGGAYSAPPNPLLDLRGPTSKGREGRGGREGGKAGERGEEGKGMKGKGGEGGERKGGEEGEKGRGRRKRRGRREGKGGLPLPEILNTPLPINTAELLCMFFSFHIFYLCTYLYAAFHLPCDR